MELALGSEGYIQELELEWDLDLAWGVDGCTQLWLDWSLGLIPWERLDRSVYLYQGDSLGNYQTLLDPPPPPRRRFATQIPSLGPLHQSSKRRVSAAIRWSPQHRQLHAQKQPGARVPVRALLAGSSSQRQPPLAQSAPPQT
ncbi:hypothetical protein JHW43_000397 [Diplocarpon mali]|nr:hypothetical protein JHW43_000397 [Diplocarpon mali]